MLDETDRLFTPSPGEIDKAQAERAIRHWTDGDDLAALLALLEVADDALHLTDYAIHGVLRSVPRARETLRRLAALQWLTNDRHGRRLTPWLAPEDRS